MQDIKTRDEISDSLINSIPSGLPELLDPFDSFGPSGSMGPMGPMGPQGPQRPLDSLGPKGASGFLGSSGFQGSSGPQDPKDRRGLTAVQRRLKNPDKYRRIRSRSRLSSRLIRLIESSMKSLETIIIS
jgi:hypothetical protein